MTDKEYLFSITQATEESTIEIINNLSEKEAERLFDYCKHLSRANMDKIIIMSIETDKNNYLTITIKAKAIFG